jgi:hypothetical protein
MVRAEAKKQRWLLLGANAILLVPAVVILVMPVMPSLWKGIVAGALIASSFWMTYGVLLIRTYPVTMGEWGESFTRDLLDRGRRRGWRVVHDLPMEHRNIDHVAITPSAVLSIETKFIGAGRGWVSDPWQARNLQDARASARAVKSLLKSQRLNIDLPVVPVLMLWGAGSPKLQQPDVLDDVHVVYGPNAKHWVAQWAAGPITPKLARTIETGLLSFQSQRDKYESAR